MTHSIFKRRSGAGRFRSRAAWATSLSALFVLGMLLTLVSGAEAAATAVPLGTADSFAVLAGAGITNTGPTTVNGDLGTYPTATLTGTASLTVTGTNHAGDAVAQGAKNDLVTAYNTAAGEGPTSPIVADLAGQTLAPGVYNSASSIGLTGVLTLNGGGDPKAVFVFQAGSTLITASTSKVNLINGAQSCNVFWQVGSSATLGTGSTFRGSILALTDITVTTGVTVDGRVLARNGAVTLDTDTITKPSCKTTTTTSAATTTVATTTTPTPEQTAATKAAVAQAAVAKAAAKQAAAAAKAAAKAAAAGDVKATTAAAARARAAAAKAQAAAAAAAKFAAVAKVKAAKAAAAQAAAAAAAARVAAGKAATSVRVAAAKAAAARHKHLAYTK